VDTIVVRPALKFCWLLSLSILLWSVGAYAQESTVEPTVEPTSSAPPASEITAAKAENLVETTPPGPPLSTKPWQTVEEVRPAAPDIYLLPDEFGKLRKVLGFRYEDFFEAWKRDERDAVAPPRYVLDALAVSGKVLRTHALLQIEFEITLQASGWIDIPVQLPEFIVQQLKIDEQMEGECLVFDKQRFGHVVWLSGQAGDKRRLVLEGLARLKLNTGNHGIELYLPRATTSDFTLHVPNSNSHFESLPELALTTVALSDNTTEVRLLGQANPLRLNWTPQDEDTANQGALIEVEGKTIVHLDRRRASYDATLKISSFRSPLEKIQVRLPEGAKLDLAETSSEFEIHLLGSPSRQDRRQLVEIRSPAPRKKPWELRLSAESAAASVSGSSKWVVEGFEVLSATRQSGALTLEVDDQLQAYFDAHGEIDQVPSKEATSTLENRSVLGSFRYTRVPWELVVFTSPRQKRVSVKPHYELFISSEEARLDVEYVYQLTGAQIFSLRVNQQGWKLTDAPIESGGLVNSDGVVETREGRLILPLVDPDTQQIRLNLSLLRKDINPGDNTLLLPEPLDAFVVDGELFVDSSEAVRITPRLDEMSGLSVIAETAGEHSVISNPDPADHEDSIRLRTFLSAPVFVAEVIQRQRQVNVAARTQVEMDQRLIHVLQRLDYQSKYQPVSQLSLNVPEQIWSNESLNVTLEGEQLPVAEGTILGEQNFDTRDDESASGNSAGRQMIVSLPRPIQNEIPLVIAYEMPAPDLATDELTPLLLPLVTPRDMVTSHEVWVSAEQPLLVTANQRSASDEWHVITGGNSVARASEETGVAAGAGTTEEAAPALHLQTTENLSYLSLNAQLDSADRMQLANLERGWIQSWITPAGRQERAVFRFRTTHATVFVQLHAAFDDAEIEVLLDGRPSSYELLAGNRLAIRLSSNSTLPVAGMFSTNRLFPNGQFDSHSLELRYQQAATLPAWGELRSSLPRLECRTASAPIYWQLILPRGWQLATSPKQLVADYWLGWKNYRWGRQPTLSQADLEQITGGRPAVAPAPLSSQYVYRAFEIPSEIQVVVIRQAWLFVACALGAFGIGLLCLYTSLARNGIFWLSLSLSLLAGIFSYPEIMLLAIQVILAGGLMTFVTAILRRIFSNEAASRISITNYQLDPSIEVTENWQRRQQGGQSDATETTATLSSSESMP